MGRFWRCRGQDVVGGRCYLRHNSSHTKFVVMAEELSRVHKYPGNGPKVGTPMTRRPHLKRESGDLLATRECLHCQPCPLLKNVCIGSESSRGSSAPKYLGDAIMGLGMQFNKMSSLMSIITWPESSKPPSRPSATTPFVMLKIQVTPYH